MGGTPRPYGGSPTVIPGGGANISGNPYAEGGALFGTGADMGGGVIPTPPQPGTQPPSLVDAWQQMQDEANQANEDRYQQLLDLGGWRYNRAGELVSGLGQAEETEINRLFGNRLSSVQQDLISRGLANTTIKPTMELSVERERVRALGELKERLLRQQLGYHGDLSGDIMGVMERRTDQQPDPTALLNYANQYGMGMQAAQPLPGTMMGGMPIPYGGAGGVGGAGGPGGMGMNPWLLQQMLGGGAPQQGGWQRPQAGIDAAAAQRQAWEEEQAARGENVLNIHPGWEEFMADDDEAFRMAAAAQTPAGQLASQAGEAVGEAIGGWTGYDIPSWIDYWNQPGAEPVSPSQFPASTASRPAGLPPPPPGYTQEEWEREMQPWIGLPPLSQ